ncbi:hypothetical protein TcCL_ESM06140 [Trypanosoma cruzi]|nr:hypothetical protein TcCL_ESM06140 [Trypanosoma cruzi]
MVTLAQLLFSWRGARKRLPTDTPQEDGDTTLSPCLPKADSFAGYLPFWRLLLCAPELPDKNLQAFSVRKKGAADASSSGALSNLRSGAELTNAPTPVVSSGKGGSLTITRSVFAGPLQRSEHVDKDVALQLGSLIPASDGATSSARWTVTDTRRMNTNPEAALGVSLSTISSSLPVDSLPDRQKLKQIKAEQMKMEARQKKELQRDEEALLEEEQRRLSALSPDATSHVLSSPSQSATFGREVLAYHEAEPEENVDICGLVNSLGISEEETEDDSSFIEGDDAIDIQDMNFLYAYYRRRDKTLVSSVQEGTVVDTSAVVASEITNQRRARCYELNSRKYIERVVLAQRSQQKIALLWLLAESMRHAWKLYFRLAQLYVNYVPLYLQAAGVTMGNEDDNDLMDITKNRYYAYFSSGTFDYEYYTYEFIHKWETLFGNVQNYLFDGGTGSVGSVGFAATLLHSMELFERQHELQVGVREVEQWLHLCWKRMNTAAVLMSSPIPTVTATNTMTMTSSSSISDSGTPDTAAGLQHDDTANGDETIEHNRKECEQQLVLTNPVDATLTSVNMRRDAMTHVPIDWWGAQDADVRAHVSWNRKKRKLLQICLGRAALRQTVPAEGPDNIASSPKGTSPQLQAWMPGALEPIMEDNGDEEAQPYRVVNVGCFGFSFFSRWD